MSNYFDIINQQNNYMGAFNSVCLFFFFFFFFLHHGMFGVLKGALKCILKSIRNLYNSINSFVFPQIKRKKKKIMLKGSRSTHLHK